MKILLAGDSTVANCPTYEYPMSGWGAQLPPHVYTWAAVHNFAKGGASTESFRAEGLWRQLLELVEEGDLVLIQFGHNDQKKVHLAARTGYAANLRTMVAEVRARGARPVLCTSVERRHFLEEADGVAELEQTLEDYPEVVREIALELQLPVVDLNSWTRDLYTHLGVEKSKELFCHFGPGEHAYWPAGLADNTHFSQEGAALVAERVASQIALLGLAPGSRDPGSRNPDSGEPDGREPEVWEVAGSPTAVRPPEDLAAAVR
ncbi:rhamnogalacturonan acetylesterase [Arthrobacter sp. D1-29]